MSVAVIFILFQNLKKLLLHDYLDHNLILFRVLAPKFPILWSVLFNNLDQLYSLFSPPYCKICFTKAKLLYAKIIQLSYFVVRFNILRVNASDAVDTNCQMESERVIQLTAPGTTTSN